MLFVVSNDPLAMQSEHSLLSILAISSNVSRSNDLATVPRKESLNRASSNWDTVIGIQSAFTFCVVSFTFSILNLVSRGTQEDPLKEARRKGFEKTNTLDASQYMYC